MKKYFIIILTILITGIIFVLFFGKIKTKPNQNSKSLESTVFYTKYYDTNDVLLINVWSIGSKTLLQESPKFLNSFHSSLKYISISTATDVKKIESVLSENDSIKKYDITINDFSALSKIFEKIDFRKNKEDNIVNFNAEITPFFAMIKNKKIYYKSNDIDSTKVKEILKQIENESKK